MLMFVCLFIYLFVCLFVCLCACVSNERPSLRLVGQKCFRSLRCCCCCLFYCQLQTWEPNKRFVTDKFGLSKHSWREAIFTVINFIIIIVIVAFACAAAAADVAVAYKSNGIESTQMEEADSSTFPSPILTTEAPQMLEKLALRLFVCFVVCYFDGKSQQANVYKRQTKQLCSTSFSSD